MSKDRMGERIVVFTRLPEPGVSKTRLIPALGEEGAAAFHDELARHTIGRAGACAAQRERCSLELRMTGGSLEDARAWLGRGRWRDQGKGDLGERLHNACLAAERDRMEKALIIGTDCPRIDGALLDEAFAALDHHELVIGPAVDGGYYLIGLRSPAKALFEGVDWGGPEVLVQTLARAEGLGLRVARLKVLSDVDVAEDLEDGRKALEEGARISVVIPALNEAKMLAQTIEGLGKLAEVIVADGGSTDATRDVARSAGARVLVGARGRAAQMNLGARSASGEFLLFLHADTMVPGNYRDRIIRNLNRPGIAAGAFRLGLRSGFRFAGLVESMVDLRCRWMNLPYGDQGLYMRRTLFDSIGGFPDWPVMEDLELVRCLARRGSIVVDGASVRSSARRWQEDGFVQTFLRHQLMLAGYYLKVPPDRLASLR